jgi:hypothetical protein
MKNAMICLMAFTVFSVSMFFANSAAASCVTAEVANAYVSGPVAVAKQFSQYCNLKMDAEKTTILVTGKSESPITMKELSEKGIDIGIVNAHECDIEGMPSLYQVANMVLKIRSTCQTDNGPVVTDSLVIERREK